MPERAASLSTLPCTRNGERVRVRGGSEPKRVKLPLTPTLSPQAGRGRSSERELLENVVDVAVPGAVIAGEELVGDGAAGGDDGLQRGEVDALVL